MKLYQRLFSLFLAMILLVSAVPMAAFAQEESKIIQKEIPVQVNPVYASAVELPEEEFVEAPVFLSEPEYLTPDEAVKVVRENLKARNTSFTVYVFTADDMAVDGMWDDLWYRAKLHTGEPGEGDNLQYQFGSAGGGLDGYSDNTGYYLEVAYNVSYYTNHAQEEELDKAVEKLLDQLNLYKKSDYEKVCGIYDYITANVKYDYAGLSNPGDLLKYTAYGALMENSAVCQGYANLFYRLAAELDVECRIVSGVAYNGKETENHAWNIVRLDGEYYSLDATWDATYAAAGLPYKYFLKGNNNFCQDHFPAEEFRYVPSDYDYVPPVPCEHLSTKVQSRKDATCTEAGYTGDTYCADCDELISSGSVIPALDHNFVNDTCTRCGISKAALDWKYSVSDGQVTIEGYVGAETELVIPSALDGYPVTRIGDLAFNGKTSLTGVTIPEGVTEIEGLAFQGCEGLTYIQLPESLTSVGENAFAYCISLTSVTIPKNLTTIGERMFEGCSKLKSVVIPEGVTEIGNGAFFTCFQLTDVTIPESVTRIGEKAFDNTGIREITIPQNVTYIGTRAFGWCNNLKTIVFTGDAPEVGYSSFYKEYVFSQTTATAYYPEDNDTWTDWIMERFGGTITWEEMRCLHANTEVRYSQSASCTYEGYTGDTYCTDCGEFVSSGYIIPMLDHIYEGIFCQVCGELKEGILTFGDCGENVNWVLYEDGLLNISGTGDMTDWVNVPDVPWYSYSNMITDVVIEEGVTSIGNQAFDLYYNVKSVVIPEGVTKIGYNAFNACYNLESLDLPSTVTYIGGGAFSGTGLTSIVLPEGLTEVGTYAFYNCSNVEQINLPSTLQKVGECAFGLSAVTRFDIPASLTQIGMNAFGSCRSLTGIYVDAGNPNYTNDEHGVLLSKDRKTLIEYPGGLENHYTVPNTVTTIAKRAFYGAKVTGVTFHDGVTTIGEDVFSGCENLTELILPAKLTVVSDGLLSQCCNLQSVTIPKGVTKIGRAAFENTGLSRVEIPASVAAIGEMTFANCNKLKEVVFAGNAPAIHEWAFWYVTATAYYPEGNPTWTEAVMQDYGGDITWISYEKPCEHPETLLQNKKDATCTVEGYTGDTYCADCGELMSSGSAIPVIDHDICALGEDAPTCTRDGYGYYGCGMCEDPELAYSVVIPAYGHNWEGDTCVNCGGKTSGVCGENVTWKLDKNGTLTISGNGPMYDHDGSDAMWFTESAGVTKVIIEEGVTRIGEYAFFWAWPNLKSVTIAGSVESIGYGAFAMCGLEEVTLGNGIKTIETAAFETCSLKDVVIPESVTYLGSAAFGDNRVINSITFKGDAPANILDNEYFVCTNPVTIYYPADNATWTNEVKAAFGENITWAELAYDLDQVENVKISSVSEDSVKIAYDKVEGAEEYEIYLNGEKIGTTSKLNYTIKNLTCGESYEVQVIAVAEEDGETLTGKPSQIIGIRPYIDLSEYKVTMDDSVAYNGEEQRPNVTVKKSSKSKTALVEGVDYILSFDNNVAIGKATVTITGINTYGGSITKSFKIVPAAPEMCAEDLTLICNEVPGATEYWYYRDGKRIAKTAETTYTMEDLKPGKVYQCTVKAVTRIDGEEYISDDSMLVSVWYFLSLEECSVSLKYDTRAYTGKAQTNTITVKNADGKTLKKDTDYKVSYEDNKKVGTATVTITGKGKYAGALTATFDIVPPKMGKVKAKVEQLQYGTSLYVTFKDVSQAEWFAIYLNGELYTMTEEFGHFTEYLEPGTYSITVRAGVTIDDKDYMGQASDPVKVTVRKSMKYCTAQMSEDEVVYTGKYIRPGVTVYGYEGEVLTEGVDYTLSYRDNKNTGKAYVEVKGKGNYDGSVKAYFAINPAPVQNLKISSATKTSVKLSFSKTSSAKSYDIYMDGQKIKTTTSSSYTVKNLEQGEDHVFYVIATKTVGGKTYKSEASQELVAHAGTYIGKYKVSLSYSSTTWNGEEKQPDVTVKTSSKRSAKTLTEGVDYIVTYANNAAVGKAKVIITGIGEYAGTITKTFKINPSKVSNVQAEPTGKKSIHVTFDTVEGLEGAQYWVYINGSRKAKVTEGSCDISGLKTGKTYKVTIRTVVELDGTKYYSDYTNTVKVTTNKK